MKVRNPIEPLVTVTRRHYWLWLILPVVPACAALAIEIWRMVK
jgi:hypothetical protein